MGSAELSVSHPGGKGAAHFHAHHDYGAHRHWHKGGEPHHHATEPQRKDITHIGPDLSGLLAESIEKIRRERADSDTR